MNCNLRNPNKGQWWFNCLIAILVLVQMPASAQLLAQSKQPSSVLQTPAAISLIDALAGLKDRHKVNILFEEKTLQNRYVSSEMVQPRATFEASLTALLEPLGLKYKKKKNNYIIFSGKSSPDQSPGVLPGSEPVNKSSQVSQPTAGRSELSPGISSAQQHVVSGRVTDEKGESLPGVSILVKGTQQGAITDANGIYALTVSDENAVLVFSFVGYQNQEVVVGNRISIDVPLKVDEKALDEVVVVGYGEQKKVNLTGAVSTVTSEKLTLVPTANVSTLLYNNLPGLIPIQRSGQPGLDDVLLSIRGFANPLVVVNGIVGRDFTRLDPNEIESISILKDAASTAVYGVSGGNGVILVTTKKGNVGKPVFNYTFNYGIQQITNYPRMVNSEEYAILKNEAAVNLGGKPLYTPEEIEKFRLGTDPNYPNFDYYKYMVRDNTPQVQQNISVRGGTDRIKYFFLLGHLSQASMWKGGNQDFSKYNFRSNIDVTVAKNLNVSVNIAGRVENRSNLTQDSYLMVSWLQYQLPIYLPKTPDGKIASTNYGLTAYLDKDLTGYIKNQRDVYEGSLAFDYKVPFLEGLSANVRLSRDMLYTDQKTWIKKFYGYAWNEGEQKSKAVSSTDSDDLKLDHLKSSAMRVQSSLNYDRSFRNIHNVKALLLYEVSEDYMSNFQASRTGYLVPIDQIFAGPDLGKNNSGGASDNGRKSYVGRVNYDYLSKYLFEYSFRYDGSPKFPPGKRWGYFQGISGGWRISEENFIKSNVNAISNLKLRASWGNLGSDNTGNFQYLAGYNYPSGDYIYGGGVITRGMAASETPNPNITWEQSQIFNLGIDLSLWRNALSIEGDVFYRKRRGLLATRSAQLPSTFGANLPAENLNSDDTRGFELALMHAGNVNDVKYRIFTNLSYARAKNRHLEQRAFNSQYDNWRNNSADRWNNVFWGYKATGQFQSDEEIYASPVQDQRSNSTLRPGDIKYEDFNKDGIIDDGDLQIIGRVGAPEVNYGFGIGATWKRFSLDMNLQGGTNFNIRKTYTVIGPFQDRNAFAYFLDRWHREDPLDPHSKWIPGKYPSTIVGGSPNNMMNSSFWFADATYLRLKSLNVTYRIKSSVLSKWGVNDCSISLSGQNLLTFSKLGAIDPEAPTGASSYYQGSLAYYPQQKIYNLGLNVTF